MPVRKHHGSWRVDFQYRGIRYRLRSPANTKEGASAFEARLKQELAIHGKLLTPSIQKEQQSNVLTLAAFLPRWFSGYVSSNNRPKEQRLKETTFRLHLSSFFGRIRLDEISIETIERYKALKKSQGLHPKTINNHLVILHKCLVTAQEWELIDEVPKMKHLKVPEPTYRYLSQEEANRLLQEAGATMWGVMIRMALRTGMRYSELSALRWENIDMEKRLITVRETVVEGMVGSTKNNRIRRIPFMDDLWSALDALRKPSGLVFELDGKHVWYKTALAELRRLCKRADVQMVSWHDLRHTFASHLTVLRAPTLAIQKLLGHSDIKMTMRYSHLATEDLRDAVSLLPSIG